MSFEVYFAGDDFLAAQGALPVVDQDQPQSPGIYLVEWQTVGGFLTTPDLIDMMKAWVEAAEQDKDFVGEVLRVWLTPLPVNVQVQSVWLEVELLQGDLPATPSGALGIVPFPFLALALITGALLAAAALVVSVGVTVDPQGWRKVIATSAIALGSSSQQLEDVLAEPPKRTLVDDVARALPIAAAVAGITYLIRS